MLFLFYRPAPSKEPTLDPPHFTVCADPYINNTAVMELGHDLNLWSMLKHMTSTQNFSTWKYM